VQEPDLPDVPSGEEALGPAGVPQANPALATAYPAIQTDEFGLPLVPTH
jgi:hypothetical protein